MRSKFHASLAISGYTAHFGHIQRKKWMDKCSHITASTKTQLLFLPKLLEDSNL